MGLEERLGHVFARKEILTLALTHRSIVNETNELEHNERMEFLGDAVLQLIVSQLLFEHYRDASEGELSKLRATAVNKDALAEHAVRLDLGAHLRLGAGEKRSGGSQKASLLVPTRSSQAISRTGLRVSRAFTPSFAASSST